MMISMLFLLTCCVALQSDVESGLRTGPWRAWLDVGEGLPFQLDVRHDAGRWHVWVVNGPERIEVPSVRFSDDELTLDFTHYDSTIRARTNQAGDRLDGNWRKRRGADLWSDVPFHATAGDHRRFPASAFARRGHETENLSAVQFNGRWSVVFGSSGEPAVADLETRADGTVVGTFLTPTGDYRYLVGNCEDIRLSDCGFTPGPGGVAWVNAEVNAAPRLRLSCFDGAHAFLFDARYERRDGGGLKLYGEFWSGSHGHDTWTAVRDAGDPLPDPFAETKWTGGASLADLAYPDLDGRLRFLADPAFAGKARIIEIFGSWCPNCHDAGAYLSGLHRKYAERGLSIVGLAFELTGDFARDAEQVRRFAARHDIGYPMLIAGVADKDKASAAFPAVDRIRAYPTTIFLDGDGSVRVVYTGFSGPATGEANKQLRAQFEAIIEETLAEP